MKHNPQAKFFCENIEFCDMPEDWNTVCEALGQPIVVDHETVSFTNRRRAYWTNIDIPIDWDKDLTPLDADDCMDPDRTVVRYTAKGTEHVRPLGATWVGSDDHPRSDSHRKLQIRDFNFTELQEPRPHEAELLMGLPKGITEGPSITNKQRLRCIGNGWDLNVVKPLLTWFVTPSLAAKVATLAAALPEELSPRSATRQKGLLRLKQIDEPSFRKLITASDTPEELLALVQHS